MMSRAENPGREALAVLFTVLMGLLLVVIYGLIAIRMVEHLESLRWFSRTLLVVFAALPPPLCFLLVRTYTRMMEDEHTEELAESWAKCEVDFLRSREHQEMQKRVASVRPEAKLDVKAAFNAVMGEFVLQRHPGMSDMFTRVQLQAADAKDVARDLARTEIRMAGLNRRAYDLPILFLSCAYLFGVELVLPLLESYAINGPLWPDLPLSKDVHVPLMVLQVGFLGGAAYAAYNLISRFLSRDVTPRLFMVSGVRLILAPVGGVLLFLVLPSTMSVPLVSTTLPMEGSEAAVVLYFAAGGFPFALLAVAAESLRSRLDVFKQRLMAGKRSTTLVEGITVFVAQRLSEEGVDAIQHLAFCDPVDLARRTRYTLATVADWKDQAILYLLAGDCVVSEAEPQDGKGSPPTLFDLLDQRAGIRSASALVRRVWEPASGGAEQVRADIELFFRELGLLPTDDAAHAKLRCESLAFLFAHLCEDAVAIYPGLRPVSRDARAVVPLLEPGRP